MENKKDWKKPALITAGFLILMWGIQFSKSLINIDLVSFGIFPRDFYKIPNILSGPFIHADFGHLFSNTIPFGISCMMIFYFYPKIAIRSFAMVYFMTGVLVWIFAKPAFHIGMSGVVYGLVTLIFWIGLFRFNVRALALMTIIFTLYSGMFAGIFPLEIKPGQNEISWESHLLGSLVGVFAAYFFRDELEEDEYVQIPETGDKIPFFPRDIFTKTKYQRWLDAQQQQQDEY
jgi:membrane associated rhomboid family serine protease